MIGRDPGVVVRFRSEAESLARLNHPNITTLYSLQREGDELFMIMELVCGQTLETLLANHRRLSEPEALAMTAQALDGLRARRRRDPPGHQDGEPDGRPARCRRQTADRRTNSGQTARTARWRG